jgi:hypothetical protein
MGAPQALLDRWKFAADIRVGDVLVIDRQPMVVMWVGLAPLSLHPQVKIHVEDALGQTTRFVLDPEHLVETA